MKQEKSATASKFAVFKRYWSDLKKKLTDMEGYKQLYDFIVQHLQKGMKKAKAKSGLNRGILDQGWGIFNSMLDYKLEDWGGRLSKFLLTIQAKYAPVATTKQKKIAKPNLDSYVRIVSMR